MVFVFFFFSSRRRHTRYWRDWSSDVCSSDLTGDRRVVVCSWKKWIKSDEKLIDDDNKDEDDTAFTKLIC